jgi:aryl-alcohol dehydrogenase-like predicted oxidoreductase
MKLALGTVQFGLDYGISNKNGQVDKGQVTDIINLAMSLGIDTLDCAGAYGESEQILGDIIAQLPSHQQFNIISKISPLTNEQSSINDSFSMSLKNLHRDKIETLLFHRAENLLNHPKKELLFEQLQGLKSQGKVNRIGVSVYSPEQLKKIALNYPIELAQVPMNVFDQRFISSDMIKLCQQKNIKFHVRSLFLQGLLFIEHDKLPIYFAPYQEKLKCFSTLAKHLNCSKLALALVIVAQNSLKTKVNDTSEPNDIIEKVVVGVCSAKQLTEIVNAYQQAQNLPISMQELLSLADDRVGFINPAMWAPETS